jgi:23S rRNA (pseudouridine1915-N3)-methyltransferase
LRVTVLAVGRLRAGPEAELVAGYLARFERTARPLGLGHARLIEVEDRRGGGREAEGALLLRQIPDTARLIALDAGGEMLTSEAFATLLRRLADGGQRELAFAIGGADGLAEPVRARAASSLSFGPMVWPHLLARVMLTEQLYRAAAILAGTPYHRG